MTVIIRSLPFRCSLPNRPYVAGSTDQDVAYRWLMLCPIRKQPNGSPETPSAAGIDSLVTNTERTSAPRRTVKHRLVGAGAALRAATSQPSQRFHKASWRRATFCLVVPPFGAADASRSSRCCNPRAIAQRTWVRVPRGELPAADHSPTQAGCGRRDPGC